MEATHDLARQDSLNESSLNQALATRFARDLIYTYVGDILLAVNPYADLPLYDNIHSLRYTKVSSKAEHPPHLFAIADAAFTQMMRTRQPQVAVISGESGAGKTFSTRLFIRQVLDVSARGFQAPQAPSSADRARHPLETRIMMTNPVLEAFGNAQTVMNSNSSRFGKFIELQFTTQGRVVGARLAHYLLEKARVVSQGEGERNFHIFEMLIEGCDDEERRRTGLHLSDEWHYVYERRYATAEQTAEWENVQDALNHLGFSSQELRVLTSILAAILQLGNLEFDDDNSGEAAICNVEFLEAAADNLGVTAESLGDGFLTEVKIVMKEKFRKRVSADRAAIARDAVGKALYDRLFTYIVAKIDSGLRPADPLPEHEQCCIGILDIFGFENFRHNGFDQLCINLANEQLHYYFNQHIFQEEMQACLDEGVQGSEVLGFTDNQAILDLFFETSGIFPTLREYTALATGRDEAFLQDLAQRQQDNARFARTKFADVFRVQHYAGTIDYHVTGMIEKNRDPLPSELQAVLQKTSNALIELIFQPNIEEMLAVTAGRASRKTEGSLASILLPRSRRPTRTQNMSFKASMRQQAYRRASRRSSQRDDWTYETALENAQRKRGLKAMKQANRRRQQNASSSVGEQFTSSLAALMFKMNTCLPHFVRCIKPNGAQKPKCYEDQVVVEQLRYTGMLETIRIRREGFAHRLTFEDVVQAYRGVCFDFTTRLPPTRDNAAKIMAACQAKQAGLNTQQAMADTLNTLDGWIVAKNKVFLKYWHVDVLDSLMMPFGAAATAIQAWYRGCLSRRRYAADLRRYRDQLALAKTFMSDASHTAKEVFGMLSTLLQEEERRGLAGLGLLQSMPPKEEKKALKQLHTEISKPLDKRRFAKSVSRDIRASQKWWLKFEQRRDEHLDTDGNVYPWFHGLLSRREAEDLLYDSPVGTFLLRVSDRSFNYALSIKHDKAFFRHYRVTHAASGGYCVDGAASDFPTLAELVDFFRHENLSVAGDRLVEPLDLIHDLHLGIGDQNGQLHSTGPSKLPRHLLEPQLHPGQSAASGMMQVSAYCQESHAWLRLESLSRSEAEAELRARGMANGRFLFRARSLQPHAVSFVISYTYERKFYHHLLAREENKTWRLCNTGDGPKEIDLRCHFLEEVVRKFQHRQYPGLACRLEMTVD